MDNERKSTFTEHYKSLSEKEKKDLREKFIEESGISYPTFYSKMARLNYSLLERRLLENICQIEFTW